MVLRSLLRTSVKTACICEIYPHQRARKLLSVLNGEQKAKEIVMTSKFAPHQVHSFIKPFQFIRT